MNKNGTTVRWIAIVVTLIVLLGFGAVTAIQNSTLKRVNSNTEDVRRIDKNQAVILFQLKGINSKLDKLLEAN